MNHLRNFSIIAHIDHGKSTLADRFIEICGGLNKRQMSTQVLDSMDIERERGITIKAQAVTLEYQAKDSQKYRLNIIDTPGHVDFSYEVSRSLAACDGALLVVDASQGVEAQSIANCWQAIEQGLEILPVLNKIDLPAADLERVKKEIDNLIGLDVANASLVSAKTGEGVDDLLESIVARIPPPQGKIDGDLRALIIDSWFDSYVGVVMLVRIVDGNLRKGDQFITMANKTRHRVESLGVFTPNAVHCEQLNTGEVGFVIAGIKDINVVAVGDTLTGTDALADKPLPGFKVIQPRVFAGFYPTDSDDYKILRAALDKLSLNDASFSYEPETSQALGFGFRCGFLGMLHMEVVQDRLEREYGNSLVTTAPSVIYRVQLTDGTTVDVQNPNELPPGNTIREIEEPIITATILTPKDSIGKVMSLCMEKRGTQKRIQYTGNQAAIDFELPLNEVVFDFFDQLKSLTHGYASFDYQMSGYRPAPLVRLDILINGDAVDALSIIVHKSKAQTIGHALVEKMSELIPRQMFDVAIQAALGSRVIARATTKALRKHVTAKCYGGDVTRKRKLLEKQKAGKKRMKQVGKVTVPQEAFLAILKVNR